MSLEAVYISDYAIDPLLDAELRGLLCESFTKPEDRVFRTRRYFSEPYPHRWVVRAQGTLVAHVGVHEKAVKAVSGIYRIGGIAEVCVHPDWRGRGVMRMMLEGVHLWLTERDYPFAVLFGESDVYSGSGYMQADNLYCGGDEEGWTQVHPMVRPLLQTPWPEGEVLLEGARF